MIYIGAIFNYFLPLSITSDTDNETLEFRIVTSEASTILVNWGDGTSDVYYTSFSSSLHNVFISHIYSDSFSGNLEISCTSGNDKITRFDNFNVTTDIVRFTTNQIGNFTGLTRFLCSNTISGSSPNVITGDIANLPSTLTQFLCGGANTTSGDISNLPNGLTSYINTGANTTTGDIADLKEGLITYDNRGANTTFGNISNLPSTLTYYLNWGNGSSISDTGTYQTTTGDLATLSAGLTYYSNKGRNTTYGDIQDLPINLATYLNWGENETEGDIANLKTALKYYSNQGNNTVSGLLQSIGATNLEFFESIGLNTISGQIHNIPSSITYFSLQGMANNLSYTTKVWATAPSIGATGGVEFIYINPTDGSFDVSEASQLVIDLDAPIWSTYPGVPKRISTVHSIASLTSPAQTAITSLSGKGVTYIDL